MCSNKNTFAGMTLMEVMVAMGIASIVFIALGSLSIYSATSFRSMFNYTELNNNSRIALDQISREIRRSRGIISAPSNSLTKTINLQMDASTNSISSISYDSSAKKLTFTKAGGPPVYLTDCTSFNWRFFTKSTVANSFEFVERNNDYINCRMIELNWLCARGNWRNSTNSEGIQSMKVVIRKK